MTTITREMNEKINDFFGDKEFRKYDLQDDFYTYVAEAGWEDWMLDYCVDATTELDELSERDLERIDEELLERFLKEKGESYIEKDEENKF